MKRNDLREGRKNVILVVDDDAAVRYVTRSVLEEYGFTVLDAANGDAGLEVFIAHREQIGLSVLDVIMPGKNGKELFADIRRIDPRARVLFTSGCGGNLLSGRDLEGPGVSFLPKPSTAQRLVDTIRGMLES